MLLLYSQAVTSRLQYIVNFFSNELFDGQLQITTDKNEYALAEGAKLNYSTEEFGDFDFKITPVPLLFESGIRRQDDSSFEINFHKAIFQTGGDLHFDIFAASFYLLSRYEEYLPHEKDSYGRYAHTNSLAFREGFLHQPLINIWMQAFKSALLRKFEGLIFKRNQFANILTYDIDMAYSYRYKGWRRNLGGAARAILKGEWRLALERFQVLSGIKKDPFDCFEWLDALHLYCRLKPWYFFLVAQRLSVYDKNISTTKLAFRELIAYYASTYHAALHPSWQSGDNPALLKEEREWFETVTGKEVTSSRQHYLRFTLPGTFRELINAGIKKDFSMGYGTINGFRASVCTPFNWYDLAGETATDLLVYPFCFMDANSFYEQKLTPHEAYAELMRYYDTVKRINGTFITIWHNHLLGKEAKTKGWNDMFELFMRETVYWDAYYDN